MLDLLEFDTPVARELPTWQLFELVAERHDRENRAELWRQYVAELLPALCSGAKRYAEVLDDYERMLKSDSERAEEIEEAHRTADDVLRRFEMARGGAMT